MKKLLALFLAALMLLSLAACGKDPVETEPSTEATTEATTEVTTEATAEATTEATTEATVPTEPGLRNPLTGEAEEDGKLDRIFAFAVGNTSAALPHAGFTQADLVFEVYVNALTTRCFAMFSNLSEVEAIGSCRSLRYPFIDLTKGYDAVVVYSGGSQMVLSALSRAKIDSIKADESGDFSYRDYNRYNSGVAWEHCLFDRGADLVSYAENIKKLDLAMDAEKDYGLRFTENATPADGQDAQQITIHFQLGGADKQTIMTYNADLGEYVYSQYNRVMTDYNNDAPVSFKNVFVVKAATHTDADGYHISDLQGTGDGYFACGGKIIAIKWVRENADDAFSFTLADGTPLEQGIGSSYIAIVPTGSAVECE